ncbi:hypothetical protein KZ478_01340, partial [Glaesserella parasuis]|nr:hypothetical protein [Glaesserella parasuis]
YGYMVGQDPPYKLFFLIKHRKPLFTFSGCTNVPARYCKKKKKKQELHKTKDKITRIFRFFGKDELNIDMIILTFLKILTSCVSILFSRKDQ